jgi:glycosyltransferase involved in cell wall biosynthesis
VKLSIIIPAFNEERLLGGTLSHLQTVTAEVFTRRGWEVELIVCDNNSTDRTAELARTAGATVVFEPINQIGRARNRGAEAATGDWLLFIDADSQPTAGLLEAAADCMASGRFVAGGSTVKLDGYHPVAQFVAGGWNALSRAFTLLAGSFIFCEAAAFRQIGGFSRELFAGEEIDLTRRLKRFARKTRPRRRIIILSAHPLLTSDRKVRLYSLREHFRFFLRTALGFGRPLKDRSTCHTWYDGRR